MNSTPAWSTRRVPEQPGLVYRDAPSQKKKIHLYYIVLYRQTNTEVQKLEIIDPKFIQFWYFFGPYSTSLVGLFPSTLSPWESNICFTNGKPGFTSLKWFTQDPVTLKSGNFCPEIQSFFYTTLKDKEGLERKEKQEEHFEYGKQD